MRKIIIYNLLLLIVLVASGLNGYGQKERLNKTYTWDFNVAEDVTFNNYDCDMTIKIWDKPITEYKMHVTAKGSSEEDVEKLDSYLKNLKFDSSPGSVNIDMRFWRSRKMIIKKIKMKLDDGQNINLTEFKISGELTVPRNCNLNFSSKYSGIELDDISGKLNMQLYNDKLYGGKVDNSVDISAKYSTYKIGELTGSLHVADGYSDKFVIPKTGEDFKGIKVNGKYGKITIGVPVDLAYRLKANIKYPNLDVNEQAFSIRIKIKEGSNLEYDAVKGTEFEGMPEFDVQGYSISLSIRDY